MTQYYYLVASLPLLFFADTPPFSSQAWLTMCREQVSQGDFALLSRISFGELRPLPGDHALWQAYCAWETALRNELAMQRAQRLGISPDPFLREAPFYTGLSAQVKEALDAETPKAAENALDRERWSYLEELETNTQFDLGRLIVYRLKLLLLERKSQFRPGPGRESFTKEYNQVLDKAAAWTSATGSPMAAENAND
ncbi:MAG: DUF2764 family protein [Candidatus Aminicenantes bacterium]|nr:DUF2764 family protein [Candidatus Aminicenantes bacterium]